MRQDIGLKGKTHDLNHDLTFSAHTINCVCHSIRSMFGVLGIYNFGLGSNRSLIWMSGIIRLLLALSPHLNCNQQVYSAYLHLEIAICMNPKFITKRLSKEIRFTWQFLTIFNGNLALRAIGYRFRQSNILAISKFHATLSFCHMERALDSFF